MNDIEAAELRFAEMAGKLLSVALQIADLRDADGLARVLRLCEGADVRLTIQASPRGRQLRLAAHLVDADAGDPLARLFELQCEQEVPSCRPH